MLGQIPAFRLTLTLWLLWDQVQSNTFTLHMKGTSLHTQAHLSLPIHSLNKRWRQQQQNSDSVSTSFNPLLLIGRRLSAVLLINISYGGVCVCGTMASGDRLFLCLSSCQATCYVTSVFSPFLGVWDLGIQIQAFLGNSPLSKIILKPRIRN